MKKTTKRLRLSIDTLTNLQLDTVAGGGINPPASKIDCPSSPGFSACRACTWA